MSLRPLLTYAHENPEVQQLADAAVNGAAERAFVSASLRPYLLAALLDSSPARPAPRALLPRPRRALRVVSRAAAASGWPARGSPRRAGRRGCGRGRERGG